MKSYYGSIFLKLIFIFSFLFLFPIFTFAELIPPNLSVPITEDGVISSFSVTCQATSTNATALLLTNPNNTQYNPFYGSLYAYMRKPCVNGVASFDSYDLKAHLEQSGEGGYDKWSRYFQPPFNLVVKDTTGLYTNDAPLYNTVISLLGAHNLYNYDTYRLENEEFKTLGYGTSYTYDEVNNWWDYISATKEAPLNNSSVLFLPGLQASRLYLDKVACTVDCTDQLWEPNGNSDVEDLYLDTSGNSIHPSIYTKDIIDETNTPITTGPLGINIYKSFIEMMNQMVKDREIRQWKPFAYDWRKDVFDIVNEGVKTKDGQVSLIQTVRELASKSRNGKVTIIAHSNGGLLAKALLYKLKETYNYDTTIDKIDRVIFVAVPQVGTPEALFALLHGYDQKILRGFIMDEKRARQLAVNMPSTYGLLPSEKYFSQSGIIDLTNFEKQSFINQYGSKLDSYQEQKDFVLGLDGRSNPLVENLISPIIGNSSLLQKSELLHDKLDSFEFPNSIEGINISGWGKETIGGMIYKDNDIRPIYTYNGDKTVVSQSALYGNFQKYWLDLSNSKIDHKNITEDKDLLNFIKNKISNTPSTTLTQIEPINTKTRLHLSVHSPVFIGIYDTEGNFTGKVCENNICQIKEDIKGSTYYEIGEGKYVNTTTDKYQKTTLLGYDTGTFTYEISKTYPDGTSTTTAFYDIPTTSSMKAEVTEIDSKPILKIDTNGDGSFDMEIGNQKEFDPILSLQIIRKTVEGLDLNEGRKNSFIKRVDNIIKLIGKGEIDKVKLRAENFTKTLQKRINKKDPKKPPKNPKQGRLSKEDAEVLLKMFEELIINLNK